MHLQDNWHKIKRHFSESFSTSMHVAIASVDEENRPTVTPIGSLFLNDDPSGFYFEKYASKLPVHASSNPNICILGVNSNRFLWLKALYKGVFDRYPAVKLYGQLGKRRKATEVEINRLKRRMRRTKSLKGHQYLWGDMWGVREIQFHKAEKINLGKMTTSL